MSKLTDRALTEGLLGTAGPYFSFDTNMHGSVCVPFANLQRFLALAAELRSERDFVSLKADPAELAKFTRGQTTRLEWQRCYTDRGTMVVLEDWLDNPYENGDVLRLARLGHKAGDKLKALIGQTGPVVGSYKTEFGIVIQVKLDDGPPYTLFADNFELVSKVELK